MSGDPRRPNEVTKYRPPAAKENAASGMLLLAGMGFGFAGFLFKVKHTHKHVDLGKTHMLCRVPLHAVSDHNVHVSYSHVCRENGKSGLC